MSLEGLCVKARGRQADCRKAERGERAAGSVSWSLRAVIGIVVMSGCLSLVGCGNALYAVRMARASDEVARAEQLDAARRAPYEYQYALEHLRKARTEALQADFGDALRLAAIAQDYASRAVQRAQKVERIQPPSPPSDIEPSPAPESP